MNAGLKRVNSGIAAAVLIGVMAGWTAPAGASPCGGLTVDILCEEFDYTAGVPNQPDFQAVWTNDIPCAGVNKVIDSSDNYGIVEPPLAAKMTKEASAGEGSGHSHRSLSALLDDPLTTGVVENGVLGTTAAPLRLDFWLDTGVQGSGPEANGYVELVLGSDRAPTDHTLSSGCGPWPIIHEGWPPGETVHAALAFGMLAYLDSDPCDPGTLQRPAVYQPAVFDGRTWWLLKSGRFGLSSDATIIKRFQHWQVEITEASIQVTLTYTNTDPDTVYTFTVPRQYVADAEHSGAFDGLAFGNGGCLDARKPVWLDSLAIYGGQRTFIPGPEGACCLGRTVCQIMDAQACSDQGGVFQGAGTACESVQCCPVAVFADYDEDSDVDADDFAALQRCLNTGGGLLVGDCTCFDTDGNGEVNGTVEVEEFVKCSTGPGVAFDPLNPPGGCNP